MNLPDLTTLTGGNNPEIPARMERILKEIRVPVLPTLAFNYFVKRLNEWWPREYTWSQEKLESITIQAEKDGLCTELGPYNFRCDWGRVTEISYGRSINLKWQISPQRAPEPDSEKASDIYVEFEDNNNSGTLVRLKHDHFGNHGEGAADYYQAMNSEQGWDYILQRFVEYCQRS